MSLPESLQTVCSFIQDYVNKTYRGDSLEFKIFQCSKAMTRVLYNHKFRLYQFAVKALKNEVNSSQSLDEQYQTYCNCTVVCDATGSPAVDKAITAVGYLEDIQDMLQIVCSPVSLVKNPAFDSNYENCLRITSITTGELEDITLYSAPILTFTSSIVNKDEYTTFVVQNLKIPKEYLEDPKSNMDEAYANVTDNYTEPYVKMSMPWCAGTAMLSIINKNRGIAGCDKLRLEAFIGLLYRSLWGTKARIDETSGLVYETDEKYSDKIEYIKEAAENNFGIMFKDSIGTGGTKEYTADEALDPFKRYLDTSCANNNLKSDSNQQAILRGLFNIWGFNTSIVNTSTSSRYSFMEDKLADGYKGMVYIEAMAVGSNEPSSENSKHTVVLYCIEQTDKVAWLADSRFIDLHDIAVKVLPGGTTLPVVLAMSGFEHVYEIQCTCYAKDKSVSNSIVAQEQEEGNRVLSEINPPTLLMEYDNIIMGMSNYLAYDSEFMTDPNTNSLGYAIALAINFTNNNIGGLSTSSEDTYFSDAERKKMAAHLISPDDVWNIININNNIESEQDIMQYVVNIFSMREYIAEYSNMNIDISDVLKEKLYTKKAHNIELGYKYNDTKCFSILIYYKHTVNERNGTEYPGSVVGIKAYFVVGYGNDGFKCHTYKKDGTIEHLTIPFDSAYKFKITEQDENGTTEYFLYQGKIISKIGYLNIEYDFYKQN